MTVHVGQTYAARRNTRPQPDRVVLWDRAELVDFDSQSPRNIVLDDVKFIDLQYQELTSPPQGPYYPSVMYSSAGADPREYVDYPIWLAPNQFARIWQVWGPITIGGLGIRLTGNETLTTNIPIYLLRCYRSTPYATDYQASYQNSGGTPVPSPFTTGAAQADAGVDATQGRALQDFNAVENQLDRDAGVFIITSPGQRDTDNFTQPELPAGWASVPNFQTPVFEKATFICFSRYVEPKVVGGQAEQVRSGAETVTVSLPDLPTRTVLTGIIQGLEFEASNVETTLLMDGVVWQVDSASELDRNRYEVVLEKRERV